MISRARNKRRKAVVGPVWAACGCSLFILFSVSVGRGAQQSPRPRQRSTVHQDPAQQPPPAPQQQPAPTPEQQPPPAQTPPREQQTPPAEKPTTPPPQTAPATPPASKTPPAKEKRLSLRERAWLTLQDGVKENAAEKRAKAVNALGLLSANREAEGMAIEALGDAKDNVRSAAATALGLMHAVHAIPQLEKALDDDEPVVVLAAANSLMLLKDNRAYDVYYDVLTGKARPNKGFIKEQLKPFHDPKKVAALGFEEGIGFVPFAGIGYEVVKRVLKSASDTSLIRAAAAKKLAQDPNPASAEALVDATEDKSWIVRVAALDAIAQRGDKSLLSKLSGSLKDSKDDVRYVAAACIVHLSDQGGKAPRRKAPAKPIT
jgi:HEAT repeat protein